MRLPAFVMKTCYELRRDKGSIDYANGGQYTPGATESIPFSGAVLPLTDEDLRYAPQGTYSADARKLYTDGYLLKVGAQVDVDGIAYTVTGTRDYGHIETLKRYIIERKGTTI